MVETQSECLVRNFAGGRPRVGQRGTGLEKKSLEYWNTRISTTTWTSYVSSTSFIDVSVVGI
jgi:hypothetical protein